MPAVVPDAIIVPDALKGISKPVDRIRSLFLWARLILGYRSKANPYFRIVDMSDGMISRGPYDTKLFSLNHERAGQDRYEWIRLLDHPAADEFRSMIAKHVPALLIDDLMRDVKVGHLVEGADAA